MRFDVALIRSAGEVRMLSRGAQAIVILTGLSGCGDEEHSSVSSPGKASVEQPTPAPVAPAGPSVRLSGRALIEGVPPHQGVILSLAFFEVSSISDDPPYGGDPPAETVTDEIQLIEDVDLDRAESVSKTIEVPFEIEHRPGVFYIQLRALLFRKVDGRVIAQSEPFFFRRRPLALSSDLAGLDLPVTWPSASLNELHHFGTFEPKKR
jgi:hypothetical protein